MTGTLRNQLVQYGMAHRLDEVLEEAIRVRAEMGYPIMATPFSQLVGIQALLNVVTRRALPRWCPTRTSCTSPGTWARTPRASTRRCSTRRFGSERGAEFQGWEPPQPSLEEVRHAHGDTLSDEELILRFLMPDPDVDAMYAAGPVQRHLPVADTPGAEMVVELMRSSRAAYLALDHGDVHLALSREVGDGT